MRVLGEHPRLALRVVCDLRPEAMEGGSPHRQVDRTTDAMEAIRHPEVDVVYLATGAKEHGRLGTLALRSGRHLIVEKPLARDDGTARELAETAARAGRMLLVGHLLHAHPAWMRIRSALLHREVGLPLHLDAERSGWGPDPAEGSAWWSLAPHDLGLALELWGPPLSLAAHAMQGPPESAAAYVAVLRWAGGRSASLRGSLTGGDRVRLLRVHTTGGGLLWDDTAGLAGLRSHGPGLDPGRILHHGSEEPLQAQIDAFAATLLDGVAPPAPVAVPHLVVQLLALGVQSMTRGGTPLPLELS
jgi:UDP-2-acetamido-3-amino-2,3-dideoxy-glucuronate N-acetyltransferase